MAAASISGRGLLAQNYLGAPTDVRHVESQCTPTSSALFLENDARYVRLQTVTVTIPTCDIPPRIPRRAVALRALNETCHEVHPVIALSLL